MRLVSCPYAEALPASVFRFKQSPSNLRNISPKEAAGEIFWTPTGKREVRLDPWLREHPMMTDPRGPLGVNAHLSAQCQQLLPGPALQTKAMEKALVLKGGKSGEISNQSVKRGHKFHNWHPPSSIFADFET
jgi:hypothetical protein